MQKTVTEKHTETNISTNNVSLAHFYKAPSFWISLVHNIPPKTTR